MRTVQSGILISLLIFMFVLSACNTNTQDVQSVDLRTNTPKQSIQQQPEQFVKLLFLTSDKYYYEMKETEITKQLNETVNGGSYNIVRVQTYYSSGFLTSVRIDYIPDTSGEGNALRLKLIQSEKYYYESKDEDIKKKLNEALISIKETVKINTVFDSGYLIAAEVWYLEK